MTSRPLLLEYIHFSGLSEQGSEETNSELDGALGNLGVSADLDFIDESGSSAKGGSVQARKLLPTKELEAFIADRKHSGVGRRLAYEWLCRVDETAPKRLLPGMLDAQAARDAVMAQTLRPYAQRGAVLIAGNGHVRRDIGVPRWLPGDAARVLSVGYLETDSPDVGFDTVVRVPAIDRDDPCKDAVMNRNPAGESARP